jgi:hypothetical protein
MMHRHYCHHANKPRCSFPPGPILAFPQYCSARMVFVGLYRIPSPWMGISANVRLPLPPGEGWGEGEGTTRLPTNMPC